MNIHKISSNKLRILLSEDDLNKYSLDYFTISSDSSETMLLLNEIILDAKGIGFSIKDCKLMVEVLPDAKGGCILYITKSKFKKSEIKLRAKTSDKPSESKARYIATFESLENAIGAILCFRTYPDLAIKESRFYEYRNFWYLCFEPVKLGLNSIRIISLLADISEYGACENLNDVKEAVLEEHGTKILKSSAIEQFIRFFN